MCNVFEVFGVVLEVLWTLQAIVYGFFLVVIKIKKKLNDKNALCDIPCFSCEALFSQHGMAHYQKYY
jgi:hypothetical protein